MVIYSGLSHETCFLPSDSMDRRLKEGFQLRGNPREKAVNFSQRGEAVFVSASRRVEHLGQPGSGQEVFIDEV